MNGIRHENSRSGFWRRAGETGIAFSSRFDRRLIVPGRGQVGCASASASARTSADMTWVGGTIWMWVWVLLHDDRLPYNSFDQCGRSVGERLCGSRAQVNGSPGLVTDRVHRHPCAPGFLGPSDMTTGCRLPETEASVRFAENESPTPGQVRHPARSRCRMPVPCRYLLSRMPA